MIAINKKKLNLIDPRIVSITSFTKGYTAEEEDLLRKKLQFARNGTLDYLSTLDIIPKEITIRGGDWFHQLNDKKTAATIDFKIQYYHFNSSSFEEKQKITESLVKQRHHLERLKNKIHACNKHFHELHDSNITGESIEHLNVTAESLDELIRKTKQEIWDLLKESETSNSIPTYLNINHINFFQTPEGFESQFSYALHKSKRISKSSHNNLDTVKNANIGRDE